MISEPAGQRLVLILFAKDLIMRQVPHYLLIGNGRVSRHFQYYFSHLNLSFAVWYRPIPLIKLKEQLKICTHILLLINDDAIGNFIKENLMYTSACCIHFSGSLIIENAYGAHPLMTFGKNLYTKECYENIYFVIDDDAPSFEKLMPGVPNLYSRLQKTLKEKYHALCVLSGNFSCLLWQKLFFSLENEFNIPSAAAYPFLQQQTKNLLEHYSSSLTGPLVRNDTQTMNKNICALKNDVFQQAYQSFITCYQSQKMEIKL